MFFVDNVPASCFLATTSRETAFEPGDHGHMKTLFNTKTEIGRILLGFKSTFYTVGTFSAVINILALVPSLYMLQVYDRVITSRNEITLLMLTLMMVGAFLFSSALDVIRSFVLVRVGARFDMQLNKR